MCASPDKNIENLEYYVKTGNTALDVSSYCTCSAFPIVPAVVLGGMMPTNAPSLSPISKFTAARPNTGGAASCQHSRREALLAADIAVTFKLVARLAARPTMRASVQTVVVERILIIKLQVR